MRAWQIDNPTLMLLTEEELRTLPTHSVLYALDGKRVIKGVDLLDSDTRFGHLAYGLQVELAE